MGGQTDENDFHHTIFDAESLTEIMARCGLRDIRKWNLRLMIVRATARPCALWGRSRTQ